MSNTIYVLLNLNNDKFLIFAEDYKIEETGLPYKASIFYNQEQVSKALKLCSEDGYFNCVDSIELHKVLNPYYLERDVYKFYKQLVVSAQSAILTGNVSRWSCDQIAEFSIEQAQATFLKLYN